MKTRIILFLVLISSAQATQAQLSCQNLFSLEQTILDRKALVEQDLSEVYAQETAGKSASEIAEMNNAMLASIEGEMPVRETSTRSVSITESTANRLLKLVLDNPVATPGNSKYDQPGTSIGYCFGRATFVHLMLLKMGVQKNSIRKIWAVGPMRAGGIMWQFHVATAVFTESKGWMIIDTNHFTPMPIRSWMNHYGSQSMPEGMVRFYATDASKFAFELGKYSRVQLGVDMSRDKDWYKNYFKDMMTWLKAHEVSEDAVVTKAIMTRSNANPERDTNMTLSDMWRSTVEFVRGIF